MGHPVCTDYIFKENIWKLQSLKNSTMNAVNYEGRLNVLLDLLEKWKRRLVEN